VTVGVRDHPAALRYEVTVDGELAGTLRYTLDGDVVTLVHTEVDPRYEGHGVGGELVKGALEDLRAHGKKARPVCEFVLAYLERHDEYRDLVQE
jgi:predicted GNAT family acetyltransferase